MPPLSGQWNHKFGMFNCLCLLSAERHLLVKNFLWLKTYFVSSTLKSCCYVVLKAPKQVLRSELQITCYNKLSTFFSQHWTLFTFFDMKWWQPLISSFARLSTAAVKNCQNLRRRKGRKKTWCVHAQTCQFSQAYVQIEVDLRYPNAVTVLLTICSTTGPSTSISLLDTLLVAFTLSSSVARPGKSAQKSSFSCFVLPLHLCLSTVQGLGGEVEEVLEVDSAEVHGGDGGGGV